MEAMHFGIYKEEDENWEVYLVIENKFPDLQGLDGIILTGSSSAAYDISEDWKEPLFNFLRKADKLKIKMFGICFGHQVLAHCLGGEAQKMIHNCYLNLIQMERLFNKKSKCILNSYRLCKQIAKMYLSYKEQNHCENYAFKSDHILDVQFHPEFNALILLYIFRNSSDPLRDIYINDCYERFKEGYDHQQIIWEFTNNFLKNK
ncbi:unnamed protein product [Paramecium pentaurelia]|uniref:Glutamine amidotransferase domain-containing protein n=1 Tax=Paramecium pentaurelia TaxID=43138 RepID=A0A8S1T2R3_9CILI|nr:unnamed protein product [Paramecium pentaurelia]